MNHQHCLSLSSSSLVDVLQYPVRHHSCWSLWFPFAGVEIIIAFSSRLRFLNLISINTIFFSAFCNYSVCHFNNFVEWRLREISTRIGWRRSRFLTTTRFSGLKMPSICSRVRKTAPPRRTRTEHISRRSHSTISATWSTFSDTVDFHNSFGYRAYCCGRGKKFTCSSSDKWEWGGNGACYYNRSEGSIPIPCNRSKYFVDSQFYQFA